MNDPSKFETEAIELVLRLRADGVVIVVVGAKDGDRGDGAAGIHTLAGLAAYRDRIPAKLRAIADDIEATTPKGAP